MNWEKELGNINLFPVPKKSSSRESNSLYLGIKELKDRVLILQYLPRNSKTSFHYHKKIIEKYIVLSGNCYVRRGESLRLLKAEETINPTESHRLETKKEGCLILLMVIHNGIKNWQNDKISV